MSHFDKFMKDIEEKQQRLQKHQASVAQDAEHHHQRERVKMYAERWQNSVRWVRKERK